MRTVPVRRFRKPTFFNGPDYEGFSSEIEELSARLQADVEARLLEFRNEMSDLLGEGVTVHWDWEWIVPQRPKGGK